MKIEAIRSIVEGNIEALNQGVRLINRLNDEQYCFIPEPYVKSSIGQHFRHVIDVFFAVVKRDGVLVDYDHRRRGAAVETERDQALKELGMIHSWMEGYLNRADTLQAASDERVSVKTEVTLEQTHSEVLPSSVARELVFTSSHAVHHYALISVIAKLQNITLEDGVGVAPATATFLRDEAMQGDEHIACAQ